MYMYVCMYIMYVCTVEIAMPQTQSSGYMARSEVTSTKLHRDMESYVDSSHHPIDMGVKTRLLRS